MSMYLVFFLKNLLSRLSALFKRLPQNELFALQKEKTYLYLGEKIKLNKSTCYHYKSP